MRRAVLGLALAIVGCNAILGNEEKELAPGEQGGGSGEASGARSGSEGLAGSSAASNSGGVASGGADATGTGAGAAGDAAGGVSTIEGGGAGEGGQGPVNPCVGATDGTSCGGRIDICLGGLCVVSDCGDGFTDELAEEECDDGNVESGDGCDSCVLSCTQEEDTCDDANPCNGVESCSESFVCTAKAPLDCDDGIPCTADSCDEANGCQNRLIDDDADGFAATALGACGTDCNDSDPAINEEASDPCDGVDNDCDGFEDEDGTATWWQDCDDDGYAPLGAPTRESCAKPAEATACAGGDWVTADPATTADCNDGSAAIRPGATELVGDQIDQNCDEDELCYRDNDNDGYRTPTVIASADTDCTDSGEARNNEPSGDCSGTAGNPVCDCNDNNAAINPGATEQVGDQVDQDCNKQERCYRDNDNDGYRTTSTVTSTTNTDCVGSGEARSTDPAGDCNDSNVSINPGRAEVCNGINDDCDAETDEDLTPPSDGEEGNSLWESANANQPSGPSLPPGAAGDSSVVSPPGSLTFHTASDNDHYVWDLTYASWNPFYQPRWMCRITGIEADQLVSMAVGAWRPGGPFDVTDCGSGSSGMNCFSHVGFCPLRGDGDICHTGLITNPSAGPDAYGFGVFVTPASGFDTCDNSYDVECKLTTDDEW